MPDYSLGESWPLGGIIAIIIGTVLAFGIVLGIIYPIKVAENLTGKGQTMA
jgi:hypothetical protein